MDRIAISMAVCQVINLLLSFILSFIEQKAVALGDASSFDIVICAGKCAIYFFAFVYSMNIFNKMNKNAQREIYEPCESKKMTGAMPLVLAGCFLGVIILSAFANKLLLGGYNDFSQNVLWQVELEHLYQILFYIALRVLLPAFLEEYFFRGMVCKSLTVYGKGTAIVVSAALFSVMHADFSQLLYTLVAGILLGYLFVETKSIIYPIILHLLNNAVWASLEIARQRCEADVYNSILLYVMASVAVIFVICSAVFAVYIIKKGELIDKLVMKPDENGDAVMPLGRSERVRGFFSRGVVLYIVYAMLRAVYLIYLSMQ